MSKKIAVIGIGNTLRRDDGIGIVVLESLLNLYRRKGIDYLNFSTASFDLIHRIQDYGIVILIDGINAGLPDGTLKIFALGDRIGYNLKDFISSTHELDLKAIFEMTKKLKIKTKIYVAGIQVENIAYGESLSAPLEQKKDDIIRKISAFIDQIVCSPH